MIDYSNFSSVEELRSFYGLQTPILESKEDDKDEEKKDNKKNEKDELEVIYTNMKQTPTNIFKHIIIFTNDKDPKGNKTLKNIYDAIDALKKAKCKTIPELHIFVAANVIVDEESDNIEIQDDDGKFVIDEQSNIDTLVFSRLGVQGEDECEHAVEILQDRGFLVLNPVKYSSLACNKYDSAILFEKGEIPQPNFTLMTKDVLYDEKLYEEAMQRLYPKWDIKDGDKNEDFMVVMKILDGHGGTGVALIDGKRIYAILQLIFAINPEQQILLQKKEEADGGDIRVHVLTLRNKQVILGAMKRVKLGGDFRSNVSLGAEAEPVKLTPEQEQIALKTAALSKLPWCAVDIMPLVKGSNKELGDNVVLEINASPGTAGISEVLKTNFINILLNELDDPKDFYLQNKIAGYIETVTVDFGKNKKELLAKLDTGNGAKASHIEVGEYKINGNKVTFKVDGKSYTFDIQDYSKAKTGDQEHNRPIIIIQELTLGQRKIHDIEMAIVKTREKSTNALLNRDVLSKLGYIVHPNDTHILTPEMEKVKII